MNTETGEINSFRTKQLAIAAGFDAQLTDDEYQLLKPMPPRERLNWWERTKKGDSGPRPTRRVFKKRAKRSR